MAVLKLAITRLKMLRDVAVEGDKLVLYGPNGMGKSSIIHTLLLVLSKASSKVYYNHNVLPSPALRNARVSVKFEDYVIEISEGRIFMERGGAKWESYATSGDAWGQDLVVWHVDEYKAVQVGFVRDCPDGWIFSTGDEIRFADGEVAVQCPTAAKRLSFQVYYNHVYDPDLEWVPISQLSYGQRRRLVIEAALETGNFVAVENFEAGLHIDYIADLIRDIADSKAAVVLETHSGLVLKLAMRHGLAAYYIDGERTRQITTLDDVELFRRELAAYQAAVMQP